MADLNSSLLKAVTKRTVLGFEYKVKLKKQWLSKKQLLGVGNIVIGLPMTGVTLFSVMRQHFVLRRKNQCKIWRTDEERLHPDCIQQMNTDDGGKLPIWDYGRTLSRIFDENMNGMTYCEVLRHELVQSMSMVPNKSELIFQQDLAAWHTSNIVQATIKQMNLKVLN